MKRTIADELKDEGRIEALQQTLISLLRQRFGRIPVRTSRRIQSTQNKDELQARLSQVLTADTLAELGIE